MVDGNSKSLRQILIKSIDQNLFNSFLNSHSWYTTTTNTQTSLCKSLDSKYISPSFVQGSFHMEYMYTRCIYHPGLFGSWIDTTPWKLACLGYRDSSTICLPRVRLPTGQCYSGRRSLRYLMNWIC